VNFFPGKTPPASVRGRPRSLRYYCPPFPLTFNGIGFLGTETVTNNRSPREPVQPRLGPS